MFQPFSASKARIESVIASIRAGRPIECPGAAWSPLDLLNLAACAQAALMSFGPLDRKVEDLEQLDEEKREAVDLAHWQVVGHATHFLVDVVFDTIDGVDRFGAREQLSGVVSVDPAGGVSVQIAEVDVQQAEAPAAQVEPLKDRRQRLIEKLRGHDGEVLRLSYQLSATIDRTAPLDDPKRRAGIAELRRRQQEQFDQHVADREELAQVEKAIEKQRRDAT